MSGLDEAERLVSSLAIKEKDTVPNSDPDPEPGRGPDPAPVRTFAMPAQLGEQDILSTLPDNCLFTIFSNFDRDTLEIMETVSQKMFCIARYPGAFVKRKKQIDDLLIMKKGNKIAFYAKPVDKSARWLVFETARTGTGTGAGIRRMMQPVRGYFGPQPQPDPEFMQIPEDLFVALEQFTLKYAPRQLSLFEVRVTATLLRRLKDAFHGQLPPFLDLGYICADDDAGLLDFLLESNIISLCVSWAMSPENFGVCLCFDPEFLTKFSDREAPMLNLYVDMDAFSDHHWLPESSFLPIICRYTSLKLESMNLNLGLLKELIKVAFSCFRLSFASWTFTFRSRLDLNNLASFNDDTFSITKKAVRSGDMFIISKKDSPYRCGLSLDSPSMEQEITITFSKDEEMLS